MKRQGRQHDDIEIDGIAYQLGSQDEFVYLRNRGTLRGIRFMAQREMATRLVEEHESRGEKIKVAFRACAGGKLRNVVNRGTVGYLL